MMDYMQQASKHHAGHHLDSVLMLILHPDPGNFWLFYT